MLYTSLKAYKQSFKYKRGNSNLVITELNFLSELVFFTSNLLHKDLPNLILHK